MSKHVWPLDFSGRRLYFQSEVSDLSGVFIPSRCNNMEPCAPGTSISLEAAWTGSEIPGAATLDYADYPDVGGVDSPSSMSVRFSGSAVLPPLAHSATVPVPFRLTGAFKHAVAATEALAGKGVASVFLTASQSFPGAWHVNRVVYSFTSGLRPPWKRRDLKTNFAEPRFREDVGPRGAIKRGRIPP